MSYVVLKQAAPGPVGGSGDATGHVGYGRPGGPTGTQGSVPETLSNCTRGIISFWFRLPQESITKVFDAYKEWKAENTAAQDAGGYGVVPPPFNGIIPLLTFGQNTEWKNVGIKGNPDPAAAFSFHPYQWIVSDCSWHYAGPNPVQPVLFQQNYDGKFDYKTSPSYIGVDVKPMLPDEDAGTPGEPLPKLVFCIQTQDKAETSGGTNALLHEASVVNSDVDDYNIVTPVDMTKCHPDGHMVFYGPNNQWHYYWLEPISEAFTTVTVEEKLLLNDEVFQTLPGPYNVPKTEGHSVPVEPNRWHHVLLSFDLTFPCKVKGRMEKTHQPKPGTIESAPQLWIALDGKNMTKKRMSHYWPATGKPNDFISVNAKSIYDSNVYPSFQGLRTYNGGGTEHYQTVIGEKAGELSYTFKPLNMLPIGLPSTDLYASHIRHVEMAELQIYPGVCIDTGVQAHREAFILGGKPVPADQKATEGNKWHPGSIEYLNKATQPDPEDGILLPTVQRTMEPEVLLHKTKKWQKGENTGAGGQFDTAGIIDPYKPDPSLGGPQGDPQ